MAYTFFEDRFMNPYDFEDPEERRKRLEEEQKRMGETEVGSTTEKTYMDGSKTITQTREVPSQQAVLRPGQGGQFMRPVMRGPVNPDDFQRIQQIESGGRQFTPQGQVVTSPKGAMGISQIMPRTAMDPGYGVPNIFDLAQSRGIQVQNRDEATARQLLSNQELNTEFGRNYFNKMNQMYGPEAGAAAYNAGPGRVQQAIQRSQQTGQPLQQFLPQETQHYLQQFGQGRGPISPEQLQQEQQQQQQPRQGILALPSVGASAEGITGEQEAQQRLSQYQSQFEQNQNNIDQLIALQKDQTAPLSFRNLANERATELLTTERNKRRAQDEAEKIKNDPVAITKVLKSEPEDEKGSWLKFLLLGFISPQAAGLEAARLGLIPTTYQRATIQNSDGTQKVVQVKLRADGKVIGGTDLENNQLSPEDLQKAMTGIAMKGVEQGNAVFADPTGKVTKSRFVKENRPGMAPVFKEIGTGRIASLAESQALIQMGVGGTLETQNLAQVQRINNNLRYDWEKGRIQAIQAGDIAANKWLGEFNAKHGTNFSINQITGSAPQIDNSGTVVQPSVTPTQTSAQMPTQGAIVSKPSQTPAEMIQKQEREGKQAAMYDKYINEDLLPKAEKASNIKNIRQEQLFGTNGILRRENAQLAGLLAGGGTQAQEIQNLFRDFVTGNYKDIPELETRLEKLNIQDQRLKNVMSIQLGLQRQLGPETIKETAPTGAITDFEQKMNQQNQVDIFRNPLYASATLMTRDLFNKELTQAKRDFAERNQQFTSRGQLDTAWTKEKSRLEKEFNQIYEERAKYIAKHGTTAAAVVAGYENYPIPRYNGTTWDYGTEFSRKAARPKLNSFER